jgi:LmbE family N-acetylglucosaminyl deacetylase
VNDSLGDSLVIEVRDLFAQDEILQKRRASPSGFQGILIIRDRQSLICGEFGAIIHSRLVCFTARSGGPWRRAGFLILQCAFRGHVALRWHASPACTRIAQARKELRRLFAGLQMVRARRLLGSVRAWLRTAASGNMITPITSEATWLDTLRAKAEWYPPAIPTVVISPHPDDETLGAGGLIAAQRRRGVPVTVVSITDGEAAYPDDPSLGEFRSAEQERALAQLGVGHSDIVRLRLPDRRVSDWEAAIPDMVRPLANDNTLLVAPWKCDPHPDHEASGRAAEILARKSGAALISYLFWAWHWNGVDSLRSLPLVKLPLDDDLQAARAAALSQYHSQLVREDGAPILPEILLAPARRPFESFIHHD